jgi:SAM-dependent methyltransferase
VTLAVQHTVAFLADVLHGCREVLEIGCGTGEVARELSARGRHVVGVDADPDAVVAAIANGIEARHARWPSFEPDSLFDAVIFTRSLHHIDPLPESIDRAAAVLRPGGLIVLEDFAYADMDDGVLRAFAERLRGFQFDDEFLAGIRDAADPRIAWHYAHSHELHRWSRMKKAVELRFAVTREETTPYLFRYVPDAHAQEVFAWEQTLGQKMLGRRLVGRAKNDVAPPLKAAIHE